MNPSESTIYMYAFVHTDHRIMCISVNVVGWELLIFVKRSYMYLLRVESRDFKVGDYVTSTGEMKRLVMSTGEGL